MLDYRTALKQRKVRGNPRPNARMMKSKVENQHVKLTLRESLLALKELKNKFISIKKNSTRDFIKKARKRE